MDPVSALSLASAITTFINFGTKLTRGTLEIYKSASGSTIGNAHLRGITQDLRDITTDLKVCLEGGSKHEKDLEDLAAECRGLGDTLVRLIDKLTVAGERTWSKSLQAKCKSMRRERDIKDLKGKLASYPSRLLLHLNLILK